MLVGDEGVSSGRRLASYLAHVGGRGAVRTQWSGWSGARHPMPQATGLLPTGTLSSASVAAHDVEKTTSVEIQSTQDARASGPAQEPGVQNVTPSVAVPGTASHRRIRLGRREWVDADPDDPLSGRHPVRAHKSQQV